MGITEVYYSQVKNVPQIFDALKQAQAPDKFTTKFLYDLGFTSVNDRPFVNVLKALNFIDESGAPKQRYYDYLDDDNSKIVLAQGIREAYSDLFAVNQKSYELKNEQVKGKLKSLLQGKKGDPVLTKMAATFVTLCTLADFAGIAKIYDKEKNKIDDNPIKTIDQRHPPKELSLKYSINIELPTTRDKQVYDAIFKSIRENLL